MNPLLKRLASLRVKVRILDGWQGACALVALVLGTGVAVGMVDYWVHLPSLVRALGLVGLLVGSGLVAYRYIYVPFARPCDDLSLALRVEEVYPELNDALASTVQFLTQSREEHVRIGGSASMRERTIQATLDKSSQYDFGRILNRRGAALFGVAACSILLVAGLLIGLNRTYAGIAFLRLVEPFGQHTWTRIEVYRQAPVEMLDPLAEAKQPESLNEKDQRKEKDRIAIGRPYLIRVDLHGQIPAQARVEIEGPMRTDKTIALQPGKDKQSASFVTAIDMTLQYQKFRFRILANDGSFPPRNGAWHEVEVLPPPHLVDLNGQPSPQITLYPPAYSDLPSPHYLAPGTRHLDLYAGTNVELRAKANRPLEQAWVEYRPENILVAPAAMLSFMGQPNPLTATAQAVGGHAVWGRFPAKFAKDHATFQVTFIPWVSGGYVLHLRDKDGLDRHEISDLRVQRDPIPEVKVLRPSSNVTALPDADIQFTYLVTDEIFAVRSVFVEYRLKTQAADGSWHVGPPNRNVLYDATAYGKWLPRLMAQTGQSLWISPDLRLRPKRLEIEAVWSLKNEFKEGDLVVVEIGADDFCDIDPGREPGRSQPIELRIVSRGQLVKEADDALRAIQQKVIRLQKMQEQAMNTVKKIQKEEKIDQRAKDEIIEAEQVQKETQDMVGKMPDEGLRGELRDLQRLLRDNKQTDTQAYQKSRMVKGALDQIATQELPQIEPKLAEARNDLTQASKNTPKTQKKLEETARLQEKVLQGLSELNKELAPYQSMLEQRAKVRDIMEKQANLQKDLENLNAEKRETDKNNPEFKQQSDEKYREDVNRKAQEQRELAHQLENILKDMRAAKDLRERSGEKTTANKIEEAIKKAEAPSQSNARKKTTQPEDKTPITSKMKNVAKDLRDKNEAPQKAIDQQKEIVNDLDQVLAALEGRTQDTTLDEIRKRQQIEDKIDEFAKELKRLQDESKQLEKIEQALKDKRKDLADKLANVQKEIDKTGKLEDPKERQLNRKELEEKLNQLEKQIEKLQSEAKKADKIEQERLMKQKQLEEKLAQLQKEKDKADKLDDMQERLKKKEELAKQEAQLQKELAELKADAKKAQQLEQDRRKMQEQLAQQKAQAEKDNAKAGKMEDAKERQKHKEELAQLQAKLQKLQDQLEKENDMQERLKQKQELIQKHEELQEKIEKAARELARLQEQRAANDLNEAAKDVENAKKKLDQGEDPQDAQKDAREKLQDAKRDIQQSEEELSRELLIKMADKLKGLKERQDAVLKRSHDLHTKVMKKKSWSDALLDTMDGNVDAQIGIADETDSLKDKLKDAKVFHSILERAKESMEKASEAMKIRREEGKDRRYIDTGEQMNAMELKDEVDFHTDTVKHQKQAAQRLDRLLDALKQELAKKPKKKQDDQVAQNDPMNEEKKEPQGGMRAADGIPGTAQLKALRAEQLDLNERTEEFAQRHPNTNQLNADQQRELRELEQEQERLQSLFQELVAPPQQKEGEPQ